jgi:hypothetical protein
VTTNQYQWRTALTDPQEIFDVIHPVGEVYVQYPQQDPPATIYNKRGITSTWTVINYNGAFFRAQGGNANAFSEKGSSLSTQADMVKSHTHPFSWSGTTSTDIADGQIKTTGTWEAGSGVFSQGGESINHSSTSGKSNMMKIHFHHEHSHTYSGSSTTDSNDSRATETRPMNYTIRIWKRTA